MLFRSDFIRDVGAPLFPRAITKPPLRLVSVRTYGDTFVQLRYEVPRERA